jgi:transcriptional regulator with XRE-family HTH domain
VQHLADLIARSQPGRSLNEISDAAGLPRNRIGYYLKPSSKVATVPSVDTVQAIAGALDCDPGEVLRAFVADLYGPRLAVAIEVSENELLIAYRKLDDSGQRAVLRLVQDLSSG